MVPTSWCFSYRVMVIADDSGFIETVKNSMSVHSIKKHGYVAQKNRPGMAYTLYDYYVDVRCHRPMSPMHLADRRVI